MSDETVLVNRPAPGVVEVVVNRPPLNILDSGLQGDLAAVLTRIADLDDLRCVLFRGAGVRAFSVGADVKEIAADPAPDPWSGVELGAHWSSLLTSLPCLTISCIHGYCLGGGLELALCTDVRLAAPDAQFGFPEVRLGLIPGMGGTVRLPRVVGRAWAKRMVMTGAAISAEQAYAIGLVEEVVADPRSAGLELAASLAAGGPLAQRTAKALIDRHVDEAGLRAERAEWHRLWATRARSEAIAAFLAHRQAVFTGD